VRAGIICCAGWHHLGPLLDAHPLFSRTALLSCFCADHAVYQQPRRARASDIFGRLWCIWLGVFAEFLRNQLAGVSTPHISRNVRDSTPECAHASAAAQRSVRREIFFATRTSARVRGHTCGRNLSFRSVDGAGDAERLGTQCVELTCSQKKRTVKTAPAGSIGVSCFMMKGAPACYAMP
jgi:hypothetical protein